MLTPLQLAVAYAAISNGGTLWEPRVAKAVVNAKGHVIKRIPPTAKGHVPIPYRYLHYIDQALLGTAKVGTMAWKMGGFPLDKVFIRSKTGTAEVYGKQTTSWVASYDKQYVVIMQIAQAGTGSGASGDSVRRIWESLYGVHGEKVVTAGRRRAGCAPADRAAAVPPQRHDHLAGRGVTGCGPDCQCRDDPHHAPGQRHRSSIRLGADGLGRGDVRRGAARGRHAAGLVGDRQQRGADGWRLARCTSPST